MLGDVVHNLWLPKHTALVADGIGLQIGWNKAAVHRCLLKHSRVLPPWGSELRGCSLSMG
jgi:hypothetical protein